MGRAGEISDAAALNDSHKNGETESEPLFQLGTLTQQPFLTTHETYTKHVQKRGGRPK